MAKHWDIHRDPRTMELMQHTIQHQLTRHKSNLGWKASSWQETSNPQTTTNPWTETTCAR